MDCHARADTLMTWNDNNDYLLLYWAFNPVWGQYIKHLVDFSIFINITANNHIARGRRLFCIKQGNLFVGRNSFIKVTVTQSCVLGIFCPLVAKYWLMQL